MFNSGVPEKVIADSSGHRSIKALREYERILPKQQKAVTEVVNNPEKSYNILAESTSTSVPVTASFDSKGQGTLTCTPMTASADSAGYVFSGNISNWTINIGK